LPRFLSVKAPTRIDLGGGWTDVPPYCNRESGFVCNVAIDKFATATVTDEPPGSDEPSRDEALIDAAVRRSGLGDVHVSVLNDYPVGAGLGGSSAASAAVLGALRTWRDIEWDLREIAEEGRVIEVEDMKIAGGRQDHYAATHGGALGLRFTDSVEVNRIDLTPQAKNALERRALVVYTGESRISGDTITAVTDAYLARDRRVLMSLKRMRELAEQMAVEVGAGDVDDLGEMVAEHWEFQRALHQAIPTPLIDQIIAVARKAGAIGGKALGASGGGCVLLIARDDSVENVRRAIEPLGTMLSCGIALDGLSLA
jgi:D-glycero-alpha-D-manno-heptose-7-phosphate kinase